MGTFRYKCKLNESSKQVNSNRCENIERERRIHTEMNTKNKNEDN